MEDSVSIITHTFFFLFQPNCKCNHPDKQLKADQVVFVIYLFATHDNKSTTCECQRSAVVCLTVIKKSGLVKRRGIILTKMCLELSPLVVYISLLIVKIYSQFQVYMFSNGRDMTKCQSFCTTTMMNQDDDNDDTKAAAIPRVFSKNS